MSEQANRGSKKQVEGVSLDIRLGWREVIGDITIPDYLPMCRLIARIICNQAFDYMNDYPGHPRCLQVLYHGGVVKFDVDRAGYEAWGEENRQAFLDNYKEAWYELLEKNIVRVSCQQKLPKGRTRLNMPIPGPVTEEFRLHMNRRMKQWFMAHPPLHGAIPEDLVQVVVTFADTAKGPPHINSVAVVVNNTRLPTGQKAQTVRLEELDKIPDDLRTKMEIPTNISDMKKQITNEMNAFFHEATMNAQGGGGAAPPRDPQQVRRQLEKEQEVKEDSKKGSEKGSKKKDSVKRKSTTTAKPRVSQKARQQLGQYPPQVVLPQGTFQYAPQGVALPVFGQYLTRMDELFPGTPMDIKRQLFVKYNGDINSIAGQMTESGGRKKSDAASRVQNPTSRPTTTITTQWGRNVPSGATLFMSKDGTFSSPKYY